jgi:molecular chaperone GrpE (heat shock protein)
VENHKNQDDTYSKMGFAMTCYFRHLQQIFKKAGIEVTAENKRDIDKVIHNIIGVDYKNCSVAWREVKKRIAEDEEDFVFNLKKYWSERK